MIGPPTFGDGHFVIYLRAEKAELGACADAEAAGAKEYTPLFSIRPKKYEDKDDATGRSNTRRPTAVEVSNRIAQKAQSICAWAGLPRDQERPRSFVDIATMDDIYPNENGTYLGDLFAHFADYKEAVPVTEIDRPAQHREIAAIHARTNAGMCLRIDCTRPYYAGDIEAALAACGVSAEHVDLLFNFGYIVPDGSDRYYHDALEQVRAATRQGNWRTMTLLAGSVPQNSHEKQFITRRFVRREWIAWRRIRAALLTGPLRVPTYGDYGMLWHRYEIPPDKVRGPQPYVRYTSWRIALYVRRKAKGKGQKSEAYRGICIEIAATPQYKRCGRGFSSADRTIDAIARGVEKASGAAAVWIRLMTEHHLVFVVRQIQGVVTR